MSESLEEKIDSKLLDKIEGIIFNRDIDPEEARELLQGVFAIRSALNSSEEDYKAGLTEKDSYLEKKKNRALKALKEAVDKRIYTKEEADMVFEKTYNQKPYKP